MKRRTAPETSNPWLPRRATPVGLDSTPAPAPDPAPVRARGPVLLAGAHGGAGTSTLASLTGLAELGADVRPHDGARVLVVARTHAVGLMAAQRLLSRAHAVTVPVAGLALVADAPGRLPRELADLVRLLSGVLTPELTWRVPWVPALRLRTAETSPRELLGLCPGAARRVIREIADLAAGEDVNGWVATTQPNEPTEGA